MPDELRRCVNECCHFVNNRPVSESDYEKAVQKNQSDMDHPGPVESLISCRKAGGVQESVEASVGFYIGSHMRRAYGTLIPEGKPPSVFDKATGNFLRQASSADLKKWRDAWSKAVKTAGR